MLLACCQNKKITFKYAVLLQVKEFINYSFVSLRKNKCKPKKSLKPKEWMSIGIINFIKNKENIFSKLRFRPFDRNLKSSTIGTKKIC